MLLLACCCCLQMRTELWMSQLHRKGPQGGAPTAGEYYDLLFEVCGPVACCCCLVWGLLFEVGSVTQCFQLE